jgi:hypothetical protein
MTIQFSFNAPNRKSGLYHAVHEIANAIRTYTPHKVILEQRRRPKGVDIYHCHNSIPYWLTDWREKHMLFQAHSYPQTMNDRVEHVNAINKRLGNVHTVVAAQRQALSPEYAGWELVRLPVALPETWVPPPKDGPIRIVATPSNTRREPGTWDKRTDLIQAAFSAVKERYGNRVETRIITRQSREYVLNAKRNSHIFVGEVTTGSYGVSVLEALAIGRVCINWLHPDVERMVWMWPGVESALPVTSYEHHLLEAWLDVFFLNGIDNLAKYGATAFAWMHAHWHPRDIANEYVKQYERILGYL